MLNTVLTMGKKTLKSRYAVAVAIPALIAAFFFNVTTLVIVIIAAVFGMVWHVALHDGRKGGNAERIRCCLFSSNS